jgi:hypothetical protein
MNVFVYMPRSGGKGDELLRELGPFVSQGSLEAFLNFSDFAARVRRPKDPLSIALVFDPGQEDLRGIASLRDFLKDTRTLLVLSDQQEETIALAHRIFPAYIAYLDNGISGTVSVLRQLIKNRRNGPVTETGSP